MKVTNHEKIEFGQKGYIQEKRAITKSTRDISQNRVNAIKITQEGTEKNHSFGHKKINYLEQTAKMTYRKINKMLGVN